MTTLKFTTTKDTNCDGNTVTHSYGEFNIIKTYGHGQFSKWVLCKNSEFVSYFPTLKEAKLYVTIVSSK